MVRRAGFWRDVALDLADGKADAHPGTPAEWFVKCAVDRVLAADGLNATPAGETMQAAQQRTEIQWLDKSEARDGR